ncbi:extracellular solute-binding protein [Anaerosporobacter sp.]
MIQRRGYSFIHKASSLLMVICLIPTVITGCGKNSSNGSEDEVPMGRYVEEEIAMPDGVAKGKEIAFQLLKNPDGALEIVSCNRSNTDDEYIYEYDGNTWNKQETDWISKASDLKNMLNMSYGDDGSIYAMYLEYGEKSSQVEIAKIKKDGSIEKVTIDDYKSEMQFDKTPFSFLETGKDSYVAIGFGSGNIYKDGKNIDSFEIGDYPFAYSNNQIMALTKDSTGIQVVDINTGEIVNELKLQDNNIPQAFSADNQGNWYVVSAGGLYRIAKDGKTWELVIDGSLTMMNDPSISIDTVVIGTENDFYIMYEGEEGKRSLYHYYYDKDMPTTPSTTLTIASMEEIPTIKNAIQYFQKSNPDIKVDYQIGLQDNTAMTKEDYIKNLNTELLAGKGPDILLLDGINVESYIEKGVLEDLGDIINPLLDQDELLDNVISNYKKEDKIYCFPIRVGIPVAYGETDAVQATTSLQSLTYFAATHKNPPIFEDQFLNTTDLINIMNLCYSSDFIQDNKVLEAEMKEFLLSLKEMKEELVLVEGDQEEGMDYFSINGDNFGDSLSIYYKKQSLSIRILNNMYDTYPIYEAIEKNKGTVDAIGNQFIPQGLISINAACKKKDIATEFIGILLSDKVQSKNLSDGFPINQKALDEFQKAKDDFTFYDRDSFEATQPSEDKRQEIIAMIRKVNIPITDERLRNLFMEDAKDYLEDKIDLDTATEKIMSKVNVYLNE